jgi:hypothetical protein
MYFDGNGDTLPFPDSNLFSMGSGNFTLEFWFYSTDTGSSTRCIVDNRANATSTSGFFLYATGTNGFAYARGSTTLLTVTGRTNNTWQYISLVRSSGVVTIYIDGTSAGSVSDTTNLTDQKFRISGFVDNQASPYAILGYLQDVRLTKGVARTITTPTAAFPTL